MLSSEEGLLTFLCKPIEGLDGFEEAGLTRTTRPRFEFRLCVKVEDVLNISISAIKVASFSQILAKRFAPC
jgi:hypothetical protein